MSITYYPGYSQQTVYQNFQHRDISAITQAFPLVVTTSVDHGYKVGVNVAFLIPQMFGMQELNSLNGDVIGVTADTLTIAIDSTNFSPFSIPISLPNAYTPPSVFANASGYQTPPSIPLPDQRDLAGTVYNAGLG